MRSNPGSWTSKRPLGGDRDRMPQACSGTPPGVYTPGSGPRGARAGTKVCESAHGESVDPRSGRRVSTAVVVGAASHAGKGGATALSISPRGPEKYRSPKWTGGAEKGWHAGQSRGARDDNCTAGAGADPGKTPGMGMGPSGARHSGGTAPASPSTSKRSTTPACRSREPIRSKIARRSKPERACGGSWRSARPWTKA